MNPRPRRFAPLASALCAACLVLASSAQAASGCEDLSSVPINFGAIDYEAQIQDLFTGWCVGCHNTGSPQEGLNLDPGFSADFIVDVPATQVVLPRVAPANPSLSYLFQKVNCAQPDAGGRMPQNGHLPVELQALIFDWIQAGVMPNSDYIFRGTNESTRF
jgi:hypothetical protein